MAKPKFYLLCRPPEGGFTGSYVIINRATQSPTGDGPWPLTAEGLQAANKTLSYLVATPREVQLQPVVHVTGHVTRIYRTMTRDGFLFRLSGHGVDGRKLSARDFTSYEAALSYASSDRVYAGGGRVLAGMGAGPPAKNKRSLEEIKARRLASRSF